MTRSLVCALVALGSAGLGGCDTAVQEPLAGQLVVSVQRPGGQGADVLAVSAAGQTRPVLRLGSAESASRPTCAPGGRRVAFQREDDADGFAPLRIAVAEGGRARVLTDPAGDLLRGSLGSWAPDGQRLVVAWRGPGAVRTFADDLAVVDAETGAVDVLTSGPATDLTPLWSPDGRWIAFVSDRSGAGQRGLFVVAPDGSGLRQVAALSGPERDVSLAGWGPGPSDVTIRTVRTDGTFAVDMWIVDVESGATRALPEPPLAAGTSRFRFETWVTGGASYVYQTSRGTGTSLMAALLSRFDVATGETTLLIERADGQSFHGTAWCPAAP